MDQGSATSDVSINLFTKENLTISNSPCQRVAINPDLPFKGKIDELRFYNYALSEREVVESDYYPDQIITRDTTIFIGESIQLMTGGTCAGLFSWSPSEGLSDTNVLSPIATPVQSTVYTFTTDDGTCAVTDQVRVSVFSREEITCDDLLLPSAFTPNEDRINDFYNISNIFLIQELKSFEIFNKWGGRVFYTEQLNSAWDGKFNSEAVQPGAYVYKVSYICQDQSFVKSGVVNVIR
jgi:gliding motility-associated-like protein